MKKEKFVHVTCSPVCQSRSHLVFSLVTLGLKCMEQPINHLFQKLNIKLNILVIFLTFNNYRPSDILVQSSTQALLNHCCQIAQVFTCHNNVFLYLIDAILVCPWRFDGRGLKQYEGNLRLITSTLC